MAFFKLKDGTNIFYEDRGEGNSIVFIHSFATNGLMFEGQSVSFAKDYRVITLDCRGCGRSDHPNIGNTVSDLASDLRELIDFLNIDNYVLVGSSIGGNISIEYSKLKDSRLNGIVLIDSPLHWNKIGITKDFLDKWLHRLKTNRPHTLENMVETWFGPHGNAALRRWMVNLLLQSGWFVDDLLRDLAKSDPRPVLQNINIPVAVFHGALDKDVPLSVAETAASLLPNSHLIIFDDCAHMPHLENPDLFENHLRNFLKTYIWP